MKKAFFIVKMWQTGNIGGHNIKKIDLNPINGFETYEEAENFLLNPEYSNEWELKNARYSFAIMQIFKP